MVSINTRIMTNFTPDDHVHDQECIADGLGDVLHAANGEETTAVANPPVTNVPWSNFDGWESSSKR